MFFRRRFVTVVLILAVLAVGASACGTTPAPTPTTVPSPQVQTATFQPATLTPLVLVVTNTALPSATPPPVNTDENILPQTATIPPTATTEDLGFLPTLTSIPATATPLPTSTPVQLLLPTAIAVATSTPYATVITQPTAIAVAAAPQAQVCATCGGLRVRQSPGTAGETLGYLDANTVLTVLGRTEDSSWIQVAALNGLSGWVSGGYVNVSVDLSGYPVSGEVENSSAPSVPSTSGGSDPIVINADLPGSAPNMGAIVSGITGTSRQIFLDGLSKGNIFNVYTAVGDSITAHGAFMTQYTNGRYALGDYSYYQPAVRWWNSLNGRGQLTFDPRHLAAAPGWSTFDVLNADIAWPDVCISGETPLHCAYRVDRPSVALIMLGTNDAGGIAPADYQANMHRIIQETINMGIIPVLSTLPDRVDGGGANTRVAAYNGIIRQLARQYDVPLWDYALALASLPNKGLSPDGVHPSVSPDNQNTVFDAEHLQYGFTMRNLTALHILDQLWRGVLYDGETQIAADPSTSPNQQIPSSDPPIVTAPDVQPTASTSGPSTDPSSGYSCPGTLSPRLTIGGTGRVTPGVPNKVRALPATSAQEVGSIPGEASFSVIGGPNCADGYTWWQVNYLGTIGWTASGNSAEYWVEP